MEGEKVQAFYRGLGINPAWGQAGPQQPPKTEEKTSTTVDLGTAFKAMTDQNATMMNAVLNMSQGTKSGATDPFVQYMMNELTAMRGQLLAAKEHPQQDQLQTMDNYITRYDGMMEKLKKNLNLPANLQLGTGNEQTAIQLKNLDLQQQERTLQFEERKHQWEVEREERKEERELREKQWAAEHNLKVQELKDKQVRSDNASSWVQDLAGAFIGSIDRGAPSLNVGAQVPHEEPPVFQVKALHCGTQGCNTRVEIPAGASEVTCPNCQMVYGLDAAAKAPPVEAPPERSLAP